MIEENSNESVAAMFSAIEKRLNLIQERVEALAVVVGNQMTALATSPERTADTEQATCGDCNHYHSPDHAGVGLCAIEPRMVHSDDSTCDRFRDVDEYRDIPLYEGVPVMWKHNNNLKETWKLGWYIQGNDLYNVKVFSGCKYRASLIVPFNYFNPESL